MAVGRVPVPGADVRKREFGRCPGAAKLEGRIIESCFACDFRLETEPVDTRADPETVPAFLVAEATREEEAQEGRDEDEAS